MRVLVADVVHAMVGDVSDPRVKAVAFEGGRIVAVGERAEVLAAAGEGAVVDERPGNAIVPGFVDAHNHFALAAVHRAGVDCSRTTVPTIDALVAALRKAAAKIPPGDWVVGYGYDELRRDEHRKLDRALLDEACPEHPVVLIERTYHEGCASSRALALLGIDRHTPDPFGGAILRGLRGEPNGKLIGRALPRAEAAARRALMARSRPQWIDNIVAVQDRLFSLGVTRIADPFVPESFAELYRAAHQSGRLKIGVVMMPIVPGAQLEADGDWAYGTSTGEGSETLRTGHAKLIFDGGRCCAVSIGPRDVLRTVGATVVHSMRHQTFRGLEAIARDEVHRGPGRKLIFGQCYYTPEEGRARVLEAVERGFTPAVHASGNEGVARALDAIAHVRGRLPAGLAPRVEHAVIMTEDLIARAADLGVTVVVQPEFLDLAGEGDLPPLPRDRFALLGFRALLDRGAVIAGSSDAPVTSADPVKGMAYAVTRRTSNGVVVQEEHSIGRYEALRMYTRASAEAAGCGAFAGTLAPGKRADLVVLSSDPLAGGTPSVLETFAGGESVFKR